MKVSYEWLQTFFDTNDLPPVEEIEQNLMFHSYEIEGVEKVGDTWVIDVDVLPNRASDSLSHRGIAKEIATIFNIPMQYDPLRESVDLTPVTADIAVTLDEDASCTYYNAAYISGVSVTESPEWLKKRLAAIGQKSINNVVDATNYVLFELGQPTHVFDADKFTGEKPHIGTRRAQPKETITLLGGEQVELTDTVSVIVDAQNDTPIAVAGVKGGMVAEVESTTTNIIIESAKFDPVQTRKASQQLKIRTDASARYENDVPDEYASYGVAAVAKLILEIAGGEFRGFVTAGEPHSDQVEVQVTVQHISRVLGLPIDVSEIEEILKRLQFNFSYKDDTFLVTAPFERRDITIPEDVIEEIGRVYGYNKISSIQLPERHTKLVINQKFAYTEVIRNTLTKLGFTEVYLYSLRDSGDIALLNSLASDKDHLRSDLASGITEALSINERQMPLLGLYDAVRIFEIGNIFTSTGEETHVAVGARVTGVKKYEERVTAVLHTAKNALEEVLGIALPEVEGDVFEFDLDALLQELPQLDSYPRSEHLSENIIYKTISAYPFVLRDIAVWVPESIDAEQVLNIIQENAGDLLVRSDLFDTFTKEGRVSYAFHLVFQSHTETLTDEKVGVIMSAITDQIMSKDDWEIR